MYIKTRKGDETVQPIKEHKTDYQQQNVLSGFVFRRRLVGEACAVEMLDSLAVSVEDNYHVQAGPHHEGHIEEITN
ncbi:hypothetical protein ACQP3D_29405, partial [Escherichia coli]